MRFKRPSVRKSSSRRAHRPDQRVYRTLRLNRRRGRERAWVAVLAGAVVAAAAVLFWLLRR